MTNYILQESQKTNSIMVQEPVHLEKFTYDIKYCKSAIKNVQSKCIHVFELYNIFLGHSASASNHSFMMAECNIPGQECRKGEMEHLLNVHFT